MVNLQVNFAGVKMRNPIGVASLAPIDVGGIDSEKVASFLLRSAELGTGYIYMPVVVPEKQRPKAKYPSARFQRIDSPGFGIAGIVGASDFSRRATPLDTGLGIIEILKNRLPQDVPIIANILVPGVDSTEWAELARKHEEAGVDLIEMNVSCPMPAAQLRAVSSYLAEEMSEAAGALLGDSISLLIPIVEQVVKAVKIPVGVKMTPETGFPRLVGLAEAIKKAGAAFICGVNTSVTVGPPDIYNKGKGKFPKLDANLISAAFGSWNRFLCYRNTAAISKFVPDIDVAAVGGLVHPEHLVEAMMLGAKIVELSSGVIWKGTAFIKRSLQFLENYMSQQGYSNVDDFIGLGLQYIKSPEEVDWRLGEIVAEVDYTKCTECNICANNICTAIRFEGRIRIAEEYCSGCGLCAVICSAGAISIIEKKHKIFGLD